MKKLAAFVILAIGLVVSAPADTLQLYGTSGNAYLGVQSFAYYLTVNGTPYEAMCASYSRTTGFGYTWLGHTLPLTSRKLQEGAWLFLQAVADHGADSNINGAEWSLFDPNVPLTSGAINWLTLAHSQNFTPGEFANVRFYESSGVVLTNGNRDQNFFVLTPEPGGLALLGSSMIGLAAWLKRRLYI